MGKKNFFVAVCYVLLNELIKLYGMQFISIKKTTKIWTEDNQKEKSFPTYKIIQYTATYHQQHDNDQFKQTKNVKQIIELNSIGNS